MIIDTCNSRGESQMHYDREESQIQKAIHYVFLFILHSGNGKIIGIERSMVTRD